MNHAPSIRKMLFLSAPALCSLLPFHAAFMQSHSDPQQKPASCLTFPAKASSLTFKGGCIAYNDPSLEMACTSACFMGAVFYPDRKIDVMHYCEGEGAGVYGQWKVTGRDIIAVITRDMRKICENECAAGPAQVPKEECIRRERCANKPRVFRETYTYRVLADSSVELQVTPAQKGGEQKEKYPCIQRFE